LRATVFSRGSWLTARFFAVSFFAAVRLVIVFGPRICVQARGSGFSKKVKSRFGRDFPSDQYRGSKENLRSPTLTVAVLVVILGLVLAWALLWLVLAGLAALLTLSLLSGLTTVLALAGLATLLILPLHIVCHKSFLLKKARGRPAPS
jgi:hypothetical protein